MVAQNCRGEGEVLGVFGVLDVVVLAIELHLLILFGLLVKLFPLVGGNAFRGRRSQVSFRLECKLSCHLSTLSFLILNLSSRLPRLDLDALRKK